MHSDMTLLVTIVSAVGFGLLAQILAHRWHIPAIVLLLGFGILLGQSVLKIVQPHVLGTGLSILVKLAVAIILFEGALNLDLKSLSQCATEVQRLVTVGVLLSWGLITLIARFIAGLEWPIALLFGALMTVTGPTVVQPLLRRIPLPRSIKTVLEGEAILVDPIGAILAIAVLDVILATATHSATGWLNILWAYFGRILIGGTVGALGAFVLAFLLKNNNLVPQELSNLVALACVWVTFGVAEQLQSEAGIMAVVAMGLITQSRGIPGLQRLRRFKETLTTLGISVIFILLAADLDITSLWKEGAMGLLAVFLMMFVARPLAVFFSTWHTRLDWRQKTFIVWVGPRGIVAASMASIFALALQESGLPGGEHLLVLTFLTILLTVTMQSLTAEKIAHLLGLLNQGEEKVFVVGANKLGCALVKLFQKYARPVLLVDTNRTAVEHARAKGLDAVYGNALEEESLEEYHVEEYATFLAVTSNSEVNVLACQLANNEFGVERTYPALSNPTKGANPALLKQTGGKLAFGRPIDIQAWELSDEEIHEFTWLIPDRQPALRAEEVPFPAGILPLLRIRRGNIELVHTEQSWQSGDEIVVISTFAQETVKKLLGGLI